MIQATDRPYADIVDSAILTGHDKPGNTPHRQAVTRQRKLDGVEKKLRWLRPPDDPVQYGVGTIIDVAQYFIL